MAGGDARLTIKVMKIGFRTTSAPALLPVALLLMVTLLSACAGSGKLRYADAKEAYEKGFALYERGKYERAIEYFQAVFEFGRASEWADDAQLYLARSYAKTNQYILAASEYSRFSDLYRTDPRRVDAEYERAMAFYELSPAYELDQTDTQTALRQFQLFVERFPTSPQAPDAEAKIGELREKLARKQYEAAGLYERRELWEAAAITYESVFDQYPDTPFADDALVGAMNAFINFAELSVRDRQVDRLEKALADYRRLVQVFPDSPLHGRAEELQRTAASRIEDLSSIAEGQ